MSLPRLLAALWLALHASCGPGAGGPAMPPREPLPPYTSADAALLDDRFSAEVFGAEPDAADPVGRRAALADGIVRARVVTVTRDSTGGRESFSVELAPAAPALKGPELGERMVLSVPVESPSFALVKSFEGELVGRTVIVFYKRFDERGQVTTHWRIEADNPRVAGAIHRARIMGELGR